MVKIKINQEFMPVDDAKHTIEIQEKQKLRLEEIEKIEIKPEKKTRKKKSIKKGNSILIITEKPQAAEKIAYALSEGKARKVSDAGVAYYEFSKGKENIIVACAVGHLFSLSQKNKGSDYPIFDIEWKPNFEVRKKDWTKRYFNLLSKLTKRAKEIIIATDYDTEGEVIGYNIVRFIANENDAKRMKFSSLTSSEIKESYDQIMNTLDWGQAIAGETRHFLDWFYGINLSRALMQSIKKQGKFKIMSIGRVQGPALNLIVEKENSIKKFKSTPYWQVFILVTEVKDKKNKIELKYIKDIVNKKELEKFEKLKNKKVQVETRKTKQVIYPPAPFDLTTLQTESYKFHGITPSRTLQAAQQLYLSGLISYPRTSSQKFAKGTNLQEILKKLSKHFKQTSFATRKKPIEGNKSDPAHPAITPTGEYQETDSDKKKVYELIVKRFISCFCEDAELENKTVETEVDTLKFKARGTEIKKQGWMQVYPVKMQEKEIKDRNGEAKIDKVKTEEKQTQPPKRYSPASILSELEKRNLGTKATRANILETLYDRNYIKDKSIIATELGIRLIGALKKHSPIIIDEKLTRDIEKEMQSMQGSKQTLSKKQEKTIDVAKKAIIKISKDFKKNEDKIGKELVQANEALWAQEKIDNQIGDCPVCKKGKLLIRYSPRFKRSFVGCSNYPECKATFSLPPGSLIKKTGKLCEKCSFPLLMSLKKGKRPWIFCFNPNCETNKEWRERAKEKREANNEQTSKQEEKV